MNNVNATIGLVQLETIEELIQKYQTIGKYSSEYSGQELWRQIINSSQRSNPAVNQSLGVK